MGTSNLVINGGTIDNTTGAAIIMGNNPTQNWNADFTYGGTRNLDLGTGAVTMSGSRQITANGTNTLTVGGPISGTGYSITKLGTGRLLLTNANSYDGGSIITAGTLSFNSYSLGSTGNITMNGGTLQWNAGNIDDVSSRIVMLPDARDLRYQRQPRDVRQCRRLGNHSLAQQGRHRNMTLSQPVTYTGGTTLTGGILCTNQRRINIPWQSHHERRHCSGPMA